MVRLFGIWMRRWIFLVSLLKFFTFPALLVSPLKFNLIELSEQNFFIFWRSVFTSDIATVFTRIF